MKRIAISALLLVSFSVCPFGPVSVASAQRTPLISPLDAARHGLTRAWFVQSQVNGRRGQLKHLLLDEGVLFVQSERGTLQAIDAETGQTLWATQVGSRDLLTQQPAANSKVVATVNGSIVYVLNRFTGEVLWMREADGPIGAGCELSEDYVFVPTVQGRVYAYPLNPEPPRALNVPIPFEEKEEYDRRTYRIDQALRPPLAAQSAGRCLVQPVITRNGLGEDVLAWVTDRGFMFLGYINLSQSEQLEIRHRVGMTPKTMYFDDEHFIGQDHEEASNIAARPSYRQPDPEDPESRSLVFVASTNGVVFAIDERTGSVAWQFSTGERIDQRIAPIRDRVYVPLQTGGMYCLEAETGRELWWTPGVERFVAASEHRLYVVDKVGRLMALNAASGARLDTILETEPFEHVFTNLENDRIFLATSSGLIQCLHESELEEPLRYHYSVEELQALAPSPESEAPAPAPADPFGGAPPATPAQNPFGGNAFGADDSTTPPTPPAPADADDPFDSSGSSGDFEEDPFGSDDDPFDTFGEDPFGSGSSSFPDNPFD